MNLNRARTRQSSRARIAARAALCGTLLFASAVSALAPPRLPKEILARLHKAVLDALRAPDVRGRFDNLSLEISTTTPQEFEAHLKSELAKWGNVVKEAGIKPD